MADLVYMTKTAWQNLLTSIKTKTGYVGTLTASQAKTAVDNIQTGGGSGPVITSASYLFYQGARLDNDKPDADLMACIIRPTTADCMFQAGSSLKSADLSSIDWSNCSTMSGMFTGCTSLTSVNFGTPTFKNLVSMNNMFQSCTKMVTNNVFAAPCRPSGIAQLFSGCQKLTTIDISGIDISGLTNTSFDNMFYYCKELTTVSFPAWNTSNITSMVMMFSNCSKLTKLDFTNWTFGATCNMRLFASGCTSLTEVVFGPNTACIGYGVSNQASAPFNNCTNLTTLRVKATTPPTIPNQYVLNTANGSTALQHIYVPAASVETYKTATNWATYASIIEADPEV